MNKIFQDAKDKYVTAVIVEGDSTKHTLNETAEVILDAFLKGVLVVAVGDVFVRPVQVSDDGAEVDVNGTSYAASDAEVEVTGA